MKKKLLNTYGITDIKVHYVTLFDNLPIGIYIADKEGLVVMANMKYYQILEYLDAEEENYKSLNSTVYHNISPFLEFDFEINNNYFEKETKSKTKNGNILDTLEIVKVKKDAIGDIYFEGTIQDNSRLKNMERTMRLLAAGVEQSGSSIVITNTEGLIEYVNNTFTKSTGYTLEEVLGKNPNVLNSGFQIKEFYTDMWNKLINGSNWQGVFHNKKKDGSLYWELALISPIKDEIGNITNYIAIKDDITIQKNLEDELKTAKTEAEEANNLKGVIIQNFSHEFRTPMNAILNTSQLLMTTLENSNDIELLSLQYESAQRLMKTLDTILKISKIESNSMKMEVIDINLTECLKSIGDKFRNKLNEKNVTLIFESNFNNYMIEIDENIFSEIIYQIIDNAIKFSEDTDISIISIIGNDLLTLIIKDNGVGIEKEKFEFIFEAFRQESEGATRNYEGLGLGLTLVRKLTQLLNGTVSIESKKGKGTSVILKISI